MTLTRDHAQMLATLAAASRPNGARRWDHAGIMAALAQVKDRSLAEVIVATIRAAADRDCETPGIIPAAGSHWAEAASVRVHVPARLDPADLCGVCSKPQDRCRSERVADDDHVFEPSDGRPPRIDVKRTVAALKGELCPVAPPPEPRGLGPLLERRPDLVAAAEEIAAACPGLRANDERELA